MREWWVQDAIMGNKLHKNFIVHSLKIVIIPFTSQTAEHRDKQIILLLTGSNGWQNYMCMQTKCPRIYISGHYTGRNFMIYTGHLCCVRFKVFKVTLLNMKNLSDTTPCWFNVLKKCSAFFFRVKQSKHGDLDCMTVKLKAPSEHW